MSNILSFLPSLLESPACTGCIHSGSCVNDFTKSYCNKRSFEPIIFENFEWNKYGVCVNPEKIIVSTTNKRVSGFIYLAKYKDGLWRFSTAGDGINEGFSGLPFAFDNQRFIDKSEALQAGQITLMHRLDQYLNNINMEKPV